MKKKRDLEISCELEAHTAALLPQSDDAANLSTANGRQIISGQPFAVVVRLVEPAGVRIVSSRIGDMHRRSRLIKRFRDGTGYLGT